MSNRKVVMSCAMRLYKAVEKVDIYAVKELVHCKGANSDIILPEYGISAFHLAVGIEPVSFSKEVTTEFLVSGGNPNVRSSEGLTPVHVAALWGRAENLELLLLAGGDLQAFDDEGYTPLHYAEEKDHLACVDAIQKFMRFGGRCSPSLGLHSELGNGIEARKSLNGLMIRKSFNKQNKLLNVPDYRLSLNRFDIEHKNSNRQETQWRMVQNNIFEDLISEDNRSDDSVQIIKATGSSLQGVNEKKRSFRIHNETYSIQSNAEVIYSDPQRTFDFMTNDDSESSLYSVNRNVNENNDKVVMNTTQVITGENSPCNYWSDSCIRNEAFIEGDWSPSGDNHNYSSEALVPAINPSYSSFLRSADSSSSSTPLQRRISHSPHCCQEEFSLQPRNKTFDYGSNISSISSISCPDIYQKCFEGEFNNVTKRRKVPYVSHKNSKLFAVSRSESEEYFTVPEEVFEITDGEEGIFLEEKRLETPVLSGRVVYRRTEGEGQICRASSASSLTSACTEEIRRELYKVVSCGCRCPMGPITATTKRVYLKMINNFKIANSHLMVNSGPILSPAGSDSKFSRELEETLSTPSKLSHGKYFELEQKMMLQFDGSGKFSQWRDGNQKSSFNYLLLDPRLTLNLPLRWAKDGSLDKSFYSNGSSLYWREFLCSIFYIGKGKRTRPYSHLYEAVNAWRSNCSDVSKLKKKVKQIIEIWKENMGVVCLHLFQNVIPAEALTREAAMIDALGLKNLTNEQRGKYYGLISTLGFSEKRYFGSFLLHRALILFLAEGERQIKPADID